MKRFAIIVSLLCSVFTLAACGSPPGTQVAAGPGARAAEDPWRDPPAQTAPVPLPRLTEPLTLDGDLKEWSGAACVPVRYRSYAAIQKNPQNWRGPADGGMEFYCAWNEQGLCLAAVVADDEVFNDLPEDRCWQEDAVEIFVDGREPNRLLKPPYSPGACQILVRPPSRDKPASVAVSKRDGKIEGLRVAGKRTDAGYVVEVLVPWTAFPALKPAPGAELGLQFALDDYDADDGNKTQPLMMSYRGARDLYNRPQNLLKWKLVEAVPLGESVPLGPLVALDSVETLAEQRSVPIAVEVGKLLAPRVDSARIWIMDPSGKALLERDVPMKALGPPWNDSRGARLDWLADCPTDGFYTVRAVLNDKNGRPLGTVVRPIAIAANAARKAMRSLQSAKIDVMSRSEPFRASNWVAVGVVLERLKRGAEIADANMLRHAASELAARVDLLEDGKLDGEYGAALDLLALTADPEAQVVFDHPSPAWAIVSFYYGSVPLAGVNVKTFASPAEAQKALLAEPNVGLINHAEPGATVAGLPARVVTRYYEFEPVSAGDFAPDKHALIVSARGRSLFIVDTGRLADVRAQAAAILPDCPPGVRQAVQSWAEKAKTPLLELSDALKKDYVLIAGSAFAGALPDKTAKFAVYKADLVERFGSVSVVKGDRLVWAQGPSRAVAQRVVEMVLAGKPIKPEDVDALRLELVKQLAPKGPAAAMPEKMNLYCGDVHSHTFYSDGSCSPAGLMMEAICCYLDFVVMSDHNTMDGALLAAALLADNRVNYPLTIGQEITTSWIHFNAYPLRELIPWTLTVEEFVKAAHAQGAVIQWNHPGFPGGEWDAVHQRTALQGTEIDAWEHVVPATYEKWKAAGMLPVITGSTDTHSGTFVDLERTIVIAPSPSGTDIAEAVRARRVVALDLIGGRLLYGPDAMVGTVWGALSEGKALKAATAERLKAALRRADIPGLIRSSPPRAVKPEPFAAGP